MIKELHTRFLFPFLMDHPDQDLVVSLLTEHKLIPVGATWELGVPHSLYRDDLLPAVRSYLFESSGCSYLSVRDVVADRLFKGAIAHVGRDRVPVGLDRPAGVELFLTRSGVGVLSMALECAVPELDERKVTLLNYSLRQAPPRPVGQLRLAHPSDDPERWARVPEPARAQIAPVPPQDAALGDRLGAPGGTFSLLELAQALLEPLVELGIEEVQPGLSIYSAVRFDASVDLASTETQSRFAPLLSNLVQAVEPGHAGITLGMLSATNAILNRRHWSATGHLGAVHIIADQSATGESPLAFDEQRAQRMVLKYFVPYLVPLLQRLALHQMVGQAGRVVGSPADTMATAVGALRNELLELSVAGNFTQVSTRDSLHRFYDLCREGLDVSEAWAELRQTLGDLESKHMHRRQEESMQRQAEISDSMAASLRVVAHVQGVLEWIEVFLISVYSAHLYHMSVGHFAKSHDHWPWLTAPHTIIGVAVFAGAIAAAFIRPWKLGALGAGGSAGPEAHPSGRDKTNPNR